MHKPIIALTLIILSVFIYLWQQTTATRMGYRVSELQSEYERINNENDSLMIKINSVLSLDKMDKIAKEKNLFKPEENFVVHIE